MSTIIRLGAEPREPPRPGVETGGESVNLDDAVLTPVASHGWRVSDARFRADEPERLLGFIEERAGQFEVMQLGGGFQWFTFPTMTDAVVFLIRTSSASTRERMAGDLSWIA